MKLRREEIQKTLGPDEVPLSLTVFPRLGCGYFTDPPHDTNPSSGASRSLFFPDEAINSGHPRFKTLTRNIRERRGSKVAINIPIFKDKNTKEPFIEDFSGLVSGDGPQTAALPDHIYMDCMGFGMGLCCLQVTFQACCIEEARLLYDQLSTLCPIFLALSAASPVYRGYLADIDSRWTVIAQSVDDRTPQERGLEPLEPGNYRIHKSRYDSIDSYLSPESQIYNDIELVYDKDLYQEMVDAGVEDALSKHMAHLFIRDPITLFSENVDQDDEEDTNHFENIQSTNWQTMRFKPPPPNSDIGWRVEFRPMDCQLTDFENAAYVVFIVLLTRAILTFKLNFVIPISKVDENMKTAHERDAVRKGKFYFKKDVLTAMSPACACEVYAKCPKPTACKKIMDEYTLMDVNEIINGKGDFVGVLPLMNKYLDSVDIDVETRCTVMQYLQLISKRASGELMTTASWMRQFIEKHPSYKHDSVVSERISYDLLTKCDEVSHGKISEPGLLFLPVHKSGNVPNAVIKTHQYLDSKNQRK
ncbi:glutamate--cysteine ligase catalytic subunit-like isoform X2 [Gigantopelta aegis]|nr:glutamate--cysteine ligase catalytic subunit-like isoform X2 [Gigantopelta aegis]